LSVFPNPNDGLFEIWLNSDDLFDIDVLDLNGRIVKQDKNILLKTGYQLNLIEIESAVYFIRARAGNQVYQSRVVIAKTL
jgi:DNA primase catalytic subunit